jgi:invasion protein IalB
MWKWIFFLVLPVVLLIGGVAWYLTKDRGGLPWQAAQVEEPSTPQGQESPTLKPNQRPQPQSPGPGWAINCRSGAQEKTLRCRLSQRVVMQGSGRLLTQVTFFLPTNTQKPQFAIQLPLGVLVPAGASIQIDENPAQRLRFRSCDRGGCYAEAALSPEMLGQLRKGSKLTIAFKNLAEKTISLPLSLGGFEEAYAKAQNV